ncbi:Zinc finger, C2H2-like protein [Cordyceps fumosorosea ARSEF 2679]|uniref:Zinc finger, C2H2-like protein n=1 Tax=Cordyceps fumosorosea (strain ARSEF 2679) TaxID=1081104 RepID=A0A167NMA0_CORFA|nr:Zinc finger, C2H2-like protein [Cordyceps fumosorosea ARSEF 2679]OAA55711.1 Zinc finger, C2H2-like protein [Cordyceps fumosorosea ARSEF 2679]
MGIAYENPFLKEFYEGDVGLSAQICLDRFQKALTASKEGGETASAIMPYLLRRSLAEAEEKFSIWTSNTTALGTGQASLEYRLRLLPGELASLGMTIDRISSELESYIAAIDSDSKRSTSDRLSEQSEAQKASSTGAQENSDADSNEEPVPVSELYDYEGSMGFINIEIESLYFSAEYICNAAAINQRIIAKPCSLNDFDQRRLSVFCRRILARDFPGISSELSDRMHGTMVERYRRLFLRTHTNKEAKRRPLMIWHEEYPLTHLLLERRDGSKPSLFRRAQGLYSVAQKMRFLLGKLTRSRREAPPHNIEALMPRPPACCRDGSDFTCDLCSMSLPSKTGLHEELWSMHVNRDLEAYVCLVDDCNQPDNLYSSAAQWLSHMSNHFHYWLCPFCSEPVQRFDHEDGLAEHFKVEHKEPDEYIPDYLPLCRRAKEIVFQDCPFCDYPPSENMAEHVACHLRYLAIASIPSYGDATAPRRDEDGDRESVASSESSVASCEASVASCGASAARRLRSRLWVLRRRGRIRAGGDKDGDSPLGSAVDLPLFEMIGDT